MEISLPCVVTLTWTLADSQGKTIDELAEPLEYHQEVRAAFLALAEQEPERYLIVDARGEVDVIAAAILERVEDG
ncbi:MAG: hypothetical protein ACO26I_08420, partial [Burkholderiaceae bacterium]